MPGRNQLKNFQIFSPKLIKKILFLAFLRLRRLHLTYSAKLRNWGCLLMPLKFTKNSMVRHRSRNCSLRNRKVRGPKLILLPILALWYCCSWSLSLYFYDLKYYFILWFSGIFLWFLINLSLNFFLINYGKGVNTNHNTSRCCILAARLALKMEEGWSNRPTSTST